jgi:RecA-family ATPase
MVGDGSYGDQYDAIPASELLREGDGTVGWLIEGLIPRGSIALIRAPEGCRKSWLALDLAYAATVGGGWMGRFPVSKSRVLLVENQSQEPPLGERFKKLAKGRGCHIPADVLVMEWEVDLDDDLAFQMLRGKVADQRPQLVIIDPLIPAGRGDENQDAALDGIFRRIGELVIEFGVTLLLVDHGRGSGRERGDGSSTPGASADELAFVDVAFTIERPNGQLVLSHLKPRWNQPMEPFAFAIEATADGGVVVRGTTDLTQAEEERRLEANEKATKTVVGEATARDASDPRRDKRQAELDDAKKMILIILGHEWMKRQEIKREAKARGISEKKMDAALKALVEDEGRAEMRTCHEGRRRWLEYRLSQGPQHGSSDREERGSKAAAASGHDRERIGPSATVGDGSPVRRNVAQRKSDRRPEQDGSIGRDDEDERVNGDFSEEDGERDGFEQRRGDQLKDDALVAAGERAVRPARVHPACTPLTQIDSRDSDSEQDWLSAVLKDLRSKLGSDDWSYALQRLKEKVFGEEPTDRPPTRLDECLGHAWRFGAVLDTVDMRSQGVRAERVSLTYLILRGNGDSASIRFITDGDEVALRHFHRVLRPAPRGWRRPRFGDPVLCTGDTGCEYCARGKRPESLAPMHVWVHDLWLPNPLDPDFPGFARAWNQMSLDGRSVYHGVVQQPRLLLAPEDLAKHILEAYQRHGTLRDRDYTLMVRSARRYCLIPGDESPLSPELEEAADILPSLGDVGRRTLEDELALRCPLLLEALQEVPPCASVEDKLERNLSAWLCWLLAHRAWWPCLRLRPGEWIAPGDWPWLLFIVRASTKERETAVNALMMLLGEPADEWLRQKIFGQAERQGFGKVTLPGSGAAVWGPRGWLDFTKNMTKGEATAARVLLNAHDVDARRTRKDALDRLVAEAAKEHRWTRTEQSVASVLWLFDVWRDEDQSLGIDGEWKTEHRVVKQLGMWGIQELEVLGALHIAVSHKWLQMRKYLAGREVRRQYRVRPRGGDDLDVWLRIEAGGRFGKVRLLVENGREVALADGRDS